MKKEQSYGAVVFNKEGKILVEKMALGHTSIPKGHIEKGETPYECALREIKEETGLEVILDTSFQAEVTYSPYPGISKDVVFFLAFYKSEEVTPQKIEVDSITWEEPSKAIEMMTFDSDKEVIKKALAYKKQA